MSILVINSGSSSLKYKVFNQRLGELTDGIVERIGERSSKVKDHKQALVFVLEKINKSGIKIDAVGHRVVHGGEKFSLPVIISKPVLSEIEKFNKLAPLHNPANIAGIKACMKLLPNVQNVAMFDTGYYKDIPDYAYMYALPYELYEKYRIRKYGFHGISHQYVTQIAAKKLRRSLHKLKIISCHLGSGCSITATKYGKAVDTSMGFTPLEGLTMGTRSGDIDPAIPLFLIDRGMKPEKVNRILNFESGLKGIFPKSNDMREILSAAGFKVPSFKPMKTTKLEKKRAKLALEMFVYDVARYIGSYTAIMGGVDAIVFTAGIGERSSAVRTLILKRIKTLGKFRTLVIPTNEELMIANQVKKLVII